jgi:dCMP deaminase
VNERQVKDDRSSWDTYFMKLAVDVATRATCPRKHVGAIIVRDKRVLATGYNGSPRGMPHCSEEGIGCELKDLGGRMSCVRTIHAEANAIAQAAQNGVSVDSATVYTTASPCYDCSKLMLNAGIKEIVYGEFYGGRYGMSEDMVKFLTAGGANVTCCQPEEPVSAEAVSPIKIIINGMEYLTSKDQLTYTEISDIVLGLGNGDRRTPTVVYRNNSNDLYSTGTLIRGQCVQVSKDLIRGQCVQVSKDLIINCVITGSA